MNKECKNNIITQYKRDIKNNRDGVISTTAGNRNINENNIPNKNNDNNNNINNIENNINDNENKITNAKNKICIIIIIIIFILLLLTIFLIIYLVLKKKKKKEEIESKESENTYDPLIIEINKKEIMKAFESNFNINTTKNTLNQLLLKSIQSYKTISNNINSSYSIFTKAKYDIYTLNESSSENNKNFYISKYTTIITINSLCTKYIFNSSEEDCVLDKYLDLNIKSEDNLRTNDELNIDTEQIIKKAILPFCIIEHTNTNIILSITCPKTLSENLKNDIILAFQSIKPDSTKGLNDEKKILLK